MNKKLLTIFILGMFLISFASALDIDNFKSYDKEQEKITIKNGLDILPFYEDKLAEYTLTDNTYQCLINCYAEGSATLYSNDMLFRDLKFEDKGGKLKTIKESTIFIEDIMIVEEEVYEYEELCEIKTLSNGTYKDCNNYITGSHVEEVEKKYWKIYNGEVLSEGSYRWRIEGIKNPKESVDWIGSAFGEDLTEWAWWDTNWIKKVLVTVPNTYIDSDLTNFPVLNILNETMISQMQSDGDDIRVVNSSETGELCFDLDYINSTNAYLWAKTNLSSSGNTQYYIYFGNPSATNGEDEPCTWSNYNHVYHMNNLTSTTIQDVKGSANVTISSGANSDTKLITGEAMSFDGTIYYTGSVASTNDASWTMTVFGQSSSTAASERGLGKISGAGAIQIRGFSNYIVSKVNGANLNSQVIGTNIFTMHDKVTSGGGHQITINGTADSVDAVNEENMQGTTICIGDLSCGGGLEWEGTIDEWRYSASSLSDAYIKADYYNYLDLLGTSFGNIETGNLLTVNLISPINDYNTTYPGINFSGNSTDDTAVVNMSLLINSIINHTIYNTTSNQNLTFSYNLTNIIDGNYTWNLQACDDSGICFNGTQRVFTIDSTSPPIDSIYPNGTINYHILGNNLTINYSISSSEQHLDKAIFNYNGVNYTFTGITNSTTFEPVHEIYNGTWYFNDTFGNLNTYVMNWNYNLLQNNESHNSTIYETEISNFILNFTSSINVQSVSSKINYNGTFYTGTSTCVGNNCILTRDLSIPLITSGTEENKSFYWEITIFDGSSSYIINSSIYNQTISRMYLAECNNTFLVKSLNFTAYDEGNLSRLYAFEFDGSFNYWISGDGSVYRNISISNLLKNETELCISPNRTFTIDGIIEYDYSSSSYIKRSYLFNNYEINKTRQDIDLLLLYSEDSTSFFQEVLENQAPVKDAYIYTYRYYPGINEWKIIQITKTDTDGKTVAFYETETTQYKHTIILNGVTRLEETEGRIIAPDSPPYTITFNLGEAVETPFASYKNDTLLSSTLSWNNNTYIVTYTYIDRNVSAVGGRLIIYKENYATEDTLICNTSSILSSASINCNLTNYSGNFIAYAYINRGVDEFINSIRFSRGTGAETFGKTGMIAGFFLILTSSMAFLFNPIVGIVAVLITTLLVNLIGFVHFGGTYLFGMIFIGGIIIWLLKD